MTQQAKTIKVRRYGDNGPYVILLHGGPAAPGYMRPIAIELEKQFRVIEPFQRGSGEERLTVARHVQDLQDVIANYCGNEKPLLVGHSWGAMLALAWAVEHPQIPKAIVLVGCGSFDAASRAEMNRIREERTDAKFRQRLERLSEKYSNPDVRLAVLGGMYQQLDSVNLVEVQNDLHSCDAAAHEQTWNDIMRLQDEEVYPKTFAAIKVPVLMLHGDDDPHPGAMIHDSLTAYLPQLEYISWPDCGHYPWLEKAASRDFYQKLVCWLDATE